MHQSSVFFNSCINVPVDPVSKMPKTSYERNEKIFLEQCSLDSSTSYSASDTDVDAEKLKDFYRSIPDYNDINHLSETDFYCTLRTLREKKKIMFNFAIRDINSCDIHFDKDKDLNRTRKQSYEREKACKENELFNSETKEVKTSYSKPRKHVNDKISSIIKEPKKHLEGNNENNTLSIKGISRTDRPKRNHSACSITWHDDKIETKKEIDEKFNKFFETKDSYKVDDQMYRTQSMPSSPLRNRRILSTANKNKDCITVPRPFKMTQRDEETKMADELRCLQKSFSDDMLHKKSERRQFKARPVPIESRIPLYDKILEDQALRFT